MNKTKVMQILNSIDLGLNIIEEGQQLDTQALTESVRTDVEDLKEELNSKPVMPKVFDEWADYVGTSGEEALADSFNTLLFWELYRDEPEENLFKWITDHSKSSLERMLRLSKCIYAIRYGYEVEK